MMFRIHFWGGALFRFDANRFSQIFRVMFCYQVHGPGWCPQNPGEFTGGQPSSILYEGKPAIF